MSRQDALVVGLAPPKVEKEQLPLCRSTAVEVPMQCKKVATPCVGGRQGESPEEDQIELRPCRPYPKGDQGIAHATEPTPHPPAQLWHS